MIKNKVSNFVALKNNRIVLLLFLLLYVGLITGSIVFTYAFKVSQDMLGQFSLGFCDHIPNFDSFINCAIINSAYFFFIIFAGLSMVGKYILFIVPFIKGLTYGYTCCFVYAVFGIRGLFIIALGILPQTFIVSILLIFSCKLSFCLSKNLYIEHKKIKIKQFIIIQLLLFLSSVVFSLADVFITGAVIDLFV